jgi:hypothetical protein
MPDDRILWSGNALKRFAPFLTMSSIHSNAGELSLHLRHEVGVPMEIRPPMTRPDGASEI